MDSWIRNQEEVFGRGLNLGQQREKERIIKLLEVLWQKTQGTDLPAVVVLPDAMALIKGEK